MAYELKSKDGELIKVNGVQAMGAVKNNELKAVDIENRTLHIIGSDETPDREGDIIMVKGWNLKNYKKNPVMMYAHNYSGIPIAAATRVKKEKEPARLAFSFRFPPVGMYEFADLILNLYGERILNASSVGFISLDWERIASDEGDEVLLGRRYLKQELLELSACAVPSNPAALQNAVKGVSSLVNPKVIEELCDGSIPLPSNKEELLKELSVGSIEEIVDDGKIPYIVPSNYDIGEKREDEEGITVKGEFEAAKNFNCECIECGWKVIGEEHCADIECEKCGGEMRRIERPGPGRATGEEFEKENYSDSIKALQKQIDGLRDAVSSLEKAQKGYEEFTTDLMKLVEDSTSSISLYDEILTQKRTKAIDNSIDDISKRNNNKNSDLSELVRAAEELNTALSKVLDIGGKK